jgi:hypothetical protein
VLYSAISADVSWLWTSSGNVLFRDIFLENSVNVKLSKLAFSAKL